MFLPFAQTGRIPIGLGTYVVSALIGHPQALPNRMKTLVGQRIAGGGEVFFCIVGEDRFQIRLLFLFFLLKFVLEPAIMIFSLII